MSFKKDSNMKCRKCGFMYKKHTGSMKLYDILIKKRAFFNIEYCECDNCGNLKFVGKSAKLIEMAENAEKKEKEKKLQEQHYEKTVHQQMIEDTGALMGLSGAIQFDKKSVLSKKGYKPKTEFGGWLKNLVDVEMVRVKHNTVTANRPTKMRRTK